MESMYYYTSSDTMSKILQNGSIWATNLNYMNDTREYANGFEEIKRILLDQLLMEKWITAQDKVDINHYKKVNIEDILTEQGKRSYLESASRFTISFYKQKDLLSQWTTYAKESGVCLEMQFDLAASNNFFMHKKDQNISDKKREVCISTKPEEIYYCTAGRHQNIKEYEETTHKILEYLFRLYEKNDDLCEYLPQQWEQTSVFVKQYDFYQEQEYRLSFDISKGPRIGYRSDDHVLKPYLDVACEYGWPIASIMVGSGFNQEPVYNSIKYFLNHENIKSSLLHTASQWRERIIEHLIQSERVKVIWNAWKHKEISENDIQNKCYAFFEFIDNLTEERIEKPAIKEHLHIGITEIVNLIKDDYFEQHYFTKSGIILEKSMIPYIF